MSPKEVIAKAFRRSKRERLEAMLAEQLLCLPAGVSKPVREHVCHPTRRWRFDVAWPEVGIAAEVEGGTWTGGRHTRGAGFESDCEKYNEAGVLGWIVFRFTAAMVRSGAAHR